MGEEELLEVAAGFVDRNAGGAIFAADTGPKGVVAIESDELERRALQGVEEAGDGGAEGREIGGGIGDAAEAFSGFVRPVGNGVGSRIDDVEIGAGLELGLVRRAEGEKGGNCEGLGFERRKEFGEAGVVVGGSGSFELGEVRGAHEEYVYAVSILNEEAGGVEDRLENLIKRRELNRPWLAELASPEFQDRLDRLGCERGANADQKSSLAISGRPGRVRRLRWRR